MSNHLVKPTKSISIHALLAESDTLYRCFTHTLVISIHALLAESDLLNSSWISSIRNFYPRSPCGERPPEMVYKTMVDEFLSTLSLRRATAPQPPRGKSSIFLSTLSLRRATIYPCSSGLLKTHFYPRSPCGERQLLSQTGLTSVTFLSTLSLRRATAKVHKTVGHFCAYETNFMEIASSC